MLNGEPCNVHLILTGDAWVNQYLFCTGKPVHVLGITDESVYLYLAFSAEPVSLYFSPCRWTSQSVFLSLLVIPVNQYLFGTDEPVYVLVLTGEPVYVLVLTGVTSLCFSPYSLTVVTGDFL